MPVKWNKAKISISGIKKVAKWASSYQPIAALLLFGSRARGEETPLSDIDLAYLPQGELPPHKREEIDREIYLNISCLLGSDEVTLINLTEAPLSVAFRALYEGETLVLRCPEELAAFKERLLAFYPEARRLRNEVLLEFKPGLKGAAMKIDREKILYHLRLIEGNLVELKEKAAGDKDEYLANSEAQILVERRFQRAIESCLNIGNHLISRLGLKLVEDYASVFLSWPNLTLYLRSLPRRWPN